MIFYIPNELLYFFLGMLVCFLILMFFGTRMKKVEDDCLDYLEDEDK